MPDRDLTAEDQAARAEAEKRIGDCIRRRGTVLDLSGLGLACVPARISQLEKLQGLDLSNNRLSALPPEIDNLSHLTRLDLSHNPLGFLPPQIGRFVNLTLLDLSHTALDTLPSEIGNLSGLTRLNLDHNRLTALPAGIGRLANLTRLVLSHNRLQTIPPELGGLAKLTRLDFSNNQLAGLSPAIRLPTGLTVLNLSHNPLGTLPPELGGLAGLTALQLADCRLESLPAEIGRLPKLTELDLTGNSLAALPESLSGHESLERLFLHDNPALQLSPYILGPDPRKAPDRRFPPARSILDFHFGRCSGRSRPFNEAKLVLLGKSGAGKSSIVQALRDLPFQERATGTTGISRCDWTLDGCGGPPVTVHVWDFSGQSATHVLHPLFWSPRNIYVVVLTGPDHSEHDDAEHWLRMIESSATGADGQRPPVIVALNQWHVPGCRPEPDRIALRERYPFIRGFVEMDCKGKKGIPALKTALFRELERMPWVREPVLEEWDAVRHSLAAAATPHLGEGDFRALCAGHGVVGEGQQDYLAEILHHLGVALSHRNDPRLPDAVILDPGWLAKHLYPLLYRAEKVAGLLSQADVELVLTSERDAAARACLMRVLECCGIAFAGQARAGQAWVLPHLQPDAAPMAVREFDNAPGAIRLRFRGPGLLEDLISRIIARRHDFIEEAGGRKLQWRRGVILLRKGARALIRMEPPLRHLTIVVVGPAKSRHQLADLCQAEIRELHAGDSAVIAEIRIDGAWVGCPDPEATPPADQTG